MIVRRLRTGAAAAAGLVIASQAGVAVVAAPDAGCEITARVLDIEKGRHTPRIHPGAPIEYYRVRLEVHGISGGLQAQGRSGCDDSWGDDPRKLIEDDRAAAKNPACVMMGCSRGIEYVWCD